MIQRIVVAGGGMTGLTAAYRLQTRIRAAGLAADTEVVVVEMDSRLGGKTQTEVVDGMVIEHGPDSFVATKPWLKDLCAELGLPLTGTNPKIHSTYIYHKGRLESLPVGMQLMIPTEFWPFVTTRLISPLGKLRAAMEPFIPIRKSGGDESIGSFVSRRFGREVLANIAGPLMGGIYGGDWDGVSLKSTFPMFLKMEQEKGSLLLAASRSKRERRAAQPKGPTGFSTFVTVPGGLAAITEALVKASAGVTFRTGTEVRAVTPATPGYFVSLSSGEQIAAAAVVLALPAYVTAGLIGQYLPEVGAELDQIPYNSSVVVAMAYHRADVKHPLDASGFLVPAVEPLDLTASTWVSSKWAHAAPPDKALFRCFLGRGGGKDWTKESDAAIVAAVRAGLERTMGLQAEPVLTRTFRWPRAMSQYRVGHLDRMDQVDRLMQAAPGLVLAGAAFRGVGLPDCVREGSTAADRVAKHLGWVAAV